MTEMKYDDGLIACSDDELVIRRYGLSLRPKKVPYAEIHTVEQIRLPALSKWRLWGTANPRLWFNLDLGRRHKEAALVVDMGKRVKPVVTPDDPRRVVALLREHGVDVIE